MRAVMRHVEEPFPIRVKPEVILSCTYLQSWYGLGTKLRWVLLSPFSGIKVYLTIIAQEILGRNIHLSDSAQFRLVCTGPRKVP